LEPTQQAVHIIALTVHIQICKTSVFYLLNTQYYSFHVLSKKTPPFLPVVKNQSSRLLESVTAGFADLFTLFLNIITVKRRCYVLSSGDFKFDLGK